MNTPAALSWDQESTPLEPGRLLLEASAGTGKTRAITAIYVRLVAEHGFNVRQILTMTFTRAATAELRDKIRRRLAAARSPAGPEAQARVRFALEEFDEARVLTIHSFCQSVLADFAIECGCPFAGEQIGRADDVLREVARDYWRRTIFDGAPAQTAAAAALKLTPEKLVDLCRRIGQRHEARFLPAQNRADWDAARHALDQAAHDVTGAWKIARQEVEEVLRHSERLSRAAKHWRADNVERTVARLAQVRAPADLDRDCVNDLLKLSRGAIADVTLKRGKGPAPTHPFFDRCEEFAAAVDAFRRALTLDFLAEARRAIPERNRARNVQTYDDLLTRVRDALRAPGSGDELARALAERYPAILVDEFQDTDPAQYDILDRIASARDDTRLYLVGDPKQAIYGFRGADLFTYLRARDGIGARLGLRHNWRSEPALVGAVNAMFGPVDLPFAFRELPFTPATPARTPRDSNALVEDAAHTVPLRLVVIEDGTPVERGIGDHVVAELGRLLSGTTKIGTRTLRPADCAVLVRHNRQAADLYRRLCRAGIRAVLHSEASVFETPEAAEMGRLMDALLDPADPGRVKAALAGPLYGWTLADIATLAPQEPEHEPGRELESGGGEADLRADAEVWVRDGFLAMFRRALARCDSRSRILERTGGERVLTNLLHLAELLDGIQRDEGLSPSGLRARLAERMRDPRRDVEEHQLRLESDGDAVQVLTVHKSKGLEYPVVFCTHFWKDAEAGGRFRGAHEPLLYHAPGDGDRLTCDLRPADTLEPGLAARASAENLSEELRLLYVGVTRAMSRCYLYCPQHRELPRSPIGHLLELRAAADSPLVDRLRQRAAECSAEIAVEIARVAPAGPCPAPEGAPIVHAHLHARTFEGCIRETHTVASFSSMVRSAGTEEGGPDPDPLPGEDDARDRAAPAPEMDNLPAARGPELGILFHRVLERADLSEEAGWRPLVDEELETAGWEDPGAADNIVAVLGRVARVALPQIGCDAGLGTLPRTEQLREVEFSFPTQAIRPAALAQLFGEHWGGIEPRDFPSRLGRLEFDSHPGILRGFIDLIVRAGGRYHLVDWKTNRLGDDQAAYEPARLALEMGRGWYHLQAQLYLLALDLHLERRLGGYSAAKHLGGACYLFLRGIDPERPGAGVYFAPANRALLDALRTRLVDAPTRPPRRVRRPSRKGAP